MTDAEPVVLPIQMIAAPVRAKVITATSVPTFADFQPDRVRSLWCLETITLFIFSQANAVGYGSL